MKYNLYIRASKDHTLHLNYIKRNKLALVFLFVRYNTVIN